MGSTLASYHLVCGCLGGRTRFDRLSRSTPSAGERTSCSLSRARLSGAGEPRARPPGRQKALATATSHLYLYTSGGARRARTDPAPAAPPATAIHGSHCTSLVSRHPPGAHSRPRRSVRRRRVRAPPITPPMVLSAWWALPIPDMLGAIHASSTGLANPFGCAGHASPVGSTRASGDGAPLLAAVLGTKWHHTAVAHFAQARWELAPRAASMRATKWQAAGPCDAVAAGEAALDAAAMRGTVLRPSRSSLLLT